MKAEKTNRINRIHYIVRENPAGVSKLLRAAGYQTPASIDELIKQTKTWIRRDGNAAIIKLLQNHPEREAILSAIKQAEGYDQFGGCACSSFDGSCGCHSSFSGEAHEQKFGGRRFMQRKTRRQNLFRPDEAAPISTQEEAVESAEEQPEKKKDQRRRRTEQERENSRASLSKGLFTINVKDLAIGTFFFGILIIASQVKS